MEGEPVLTQNGDEKYPYMLRSPVSSPALFGVGAPEQRDREADLSSAGLAVCLQQDQDKPAAGISGSGVKHFKWK